MGEFKQKVVRGSASVLATASTFLFRRFVRRAFNQINFNNFEIDGKKETDIQKTEFHANMQSSAEQRNIMQISKSDW